MHDWILPRGELVSGQYEVRALLGEGAMGQVFEAHDRALNRRVALKVARPHLDPALLRLEAQGIAAVRHHGVAGVYALGEHRGHAYLVMERLKGVTLEAHMAARHDEAELFTMAEALDVLVPLADALAAVHDAGIAHRDVKPANVMITVGDRVVLTDFGIVSPERDVTRGAFVGTASYAAPETLTGTTEPGMGFLADVYAFGVVAFEMVAARRPFEGETPEETRRMHLEDMAPPVSEGRDDVPPLFTAIVAELLSKDPHDRPRSMSEVASRLRSPAMRSMTAIRSSPPEGRVIPFTKAQLRRVRG